MLQVTTNNAIYSEIDANAGNDFTMEKNSCYENVMHHANNSAKHTCNMFYLILALVVIVHASWHVIVSAWDQGLFEKKTLSIRITIVNANIFYNHVL